MTFVAITRDLSDWAVMSDNHGLPYEILRELSHQKITSGDVSSDEVGRSKLAVALSDADTLEVVHPFRAHPHCYPVVPGRGEVCPGRCYQKPGVANDQGLVLQDVYTFCSRIAHLGQRAVDVAFVELVVATDVDHRTVEGVVGPGHSATTHRDVASQHHQIALRRRRLEVRELQMEI